MECLRSKNTPRDIQHSHYYDQNIVLQLICNTSLQTDLLKEELFKHTT
jgi:hypothetical protein